MMNLRRLAISAIAATLLLALAAPSASAHASGYTTDGKLRLVFGWVNEPATTDVPNRVLLRVLDNVTGAGIAGIDQIEGLEVALHLGDEEKELEMAPLRGAAIGNYSSEDLIAPSQPGIYELHVKGTINGSEVDVEIAANEELTDIEETRWPPVEPTGERVEKLEQEVELLKAQIATLDAKLKTQAQTPATVTTQTPTAEGNGSSPVPALGLLALLGVVGLVVLLRRSK